jgi:hypothetical protein
MNSPDARHAHLATILLILSLMQSFDPKFFIGFAAT